MGLLSIMTIVLCAACAGIAAWLGWQLLRQNGRLLLRVEELESRLEEWEFGEASEPGHPFTPPLSPDGGEGEAPDRASRFSSRSLTQSKIKRDGLKAGTPAPDFRLPRLDGRGELSLEEMRGRRVLLVFSDPHCGPCNMIAPELENFHRSQADRDRSPVAALGRCVPHPGHRGAPPG